MDMNFLAVVKLTPDIYHIQSSSSRYKTLSQESTVVPQVMRRITPLLCKILLVPCFGIQKPSCTLKMKYQYSRVKESARKNGYSWVPRIRVR